MIRKTWKICVTFLTFVCVCVFWLIQVRRIFVALQNVKIQKIGGGGVDTEGGSVTQNG